MQFELPNPLHPAVVHFPIVLTILGTIAAFLSVLTRRGALPQWTALLLILAAAAAQYAVYTGGDQEQLFSTLPSNLNDLVHEHAEWGERTRTVLVGAAVLSLIALASYRFLNLRRVFALLTLLAALGASWCLVQAATRGGTLVYQNQVGTQKQNTVLPGAAESSPATGTPSPQ
jgi:uncharacterized membrane protein